MTGKDLTIKEQYPLGGLTTFGIGGSARYFAVVTSEEEAREALAFARHKGIETFVLGGGSNILISDQGFPGLVILNGIKGFTSRPAAGEDDEVLVTAGAGEDWDGFTRRCIESNLQGIECLSGVPGTVGAAPVQNIGAYGQSADSVVEQVRALEVAAGRAVIFTNQECSFGYRKSLFNSIAAGRYLIVEATFKLKQNGAPSVTYHDLKAALSGLPDPTLQQVREAVLKIREGKGLLALDGYERFKSAGSFFKNPVVSAEHFTGVEEAVRKAGGCANWSWPQRSGEVKVSAACLIQSAGFVRGFRKGNVGISPRHTLAVINYGDATAGEVAAFARQVQEAVLRQFGVVLKPEVQFVGFTPDLL